MMWTSSGSVALLLVMANNWATIVAGLVDSSSAVALQSFYRDINNVVSARIHQTADQSEQLSPKEWLPRIHIDELLGSPSNDVLGSVIEQGCCVVDVAGSDARGILASMWDVLRHEIYGNPMLSLGPESLRHETIQRDSDSAEGGYEYLHWSRRTGDQEEVKAIVGEECYTTLRNAYGILEDIATAYTTASLALCCKEHVDDLRSCWMNREFSFQRLARYRPTTHESLRPHCDWSLVTLIPLSDVPGLEIYSSKHGGWVRPEAHCSAGVVVMSGKWLEILTGIESTIHRVVIQDAVRFSAPFFFRPDSNMEGVEFDQQESMDQTATRIRENMLRS